MTKLKPCPFCGESMGLLNTFQEVGTPSGDLGFSTVIQCEKCKHTIKVWALKKDWSIESALKIWNRRYGEEK